ncbi:MAG: efflux RND transporter periplasmic adaptor subunit [bacterium]
MKFPVLSRRKKILAAVGAVVVLIVVLSVVFGGQPKVEYETYAVDRGDVVEVISVTGSIAPSSKIELQPEVSGRVTEIAVAEGQEVKAGDLLVRLDTADIEAQILAQRAALASAQAKLAEYQAGPTEAELAVTERGVETSRTRLEASRLARDDAKVALDNAQKSLLNAREKAQIQVSVKVNSFLTDMDDASIAANDAVNRLTAPLFDSVGFLSFSVNSAQASNDAISTRRAALNALAPIEAARITAAADPTPDTVRLQYANMVPHLSSVKTYLEAVNSALNSAIGVDATTLATYRANTNTARAALSSAMQSLLSDSSGLDLQVRQNDTDLISAEVGVSNAVAALNTAEKTVTTNESLLAEAEASLVLKRAGVRPEGVAAQRAAVAAESARLVGLQNDLNKRLVSAPIDCTVTKVSVELGERVQVSQTVVELNAKGNLEVIANISEIDIAKLHVGDPVSVALDAFVGGESWTGTVTAIQPAETVVDNVIFYKTTVKFDAEDERLRSGMTADLGIETDRRTGALRVPVRALRRDSDGPYVELLGDGDAVRRVSVDVGLESDDHVEITAGLREGDDVVVYRLEK